MKHDHIDAPISPLICPKFPQYNLFPIECSLF